MKPLQTAQPSEHGTLPAPPRSHFSRWLLPAGLLLLVVASFASLSLEWEALFSADALRSMSDFLRGFAQPTLTPTFLYKTAVATLETLSMSALGTLLAAVGGLMWALPAAGHFGKLPRAGTRLLLNVLRSVPELVWAALLLILAGLGPFAGTLALAVHTTGVLGRLFAEALENTDPTPESILRTNGVQALPAFFYATLPQILPQLLSYTLYRWENNIRAAAILGVVGAGGLGQMLKYHLSLFQMSSAATVLLAMLVLVAGVDAFSFGLRRLMTR